MANTDIPMGFLPRFGDAPKHKHDVSSSNSTAILRGAPVVRDTGGYIVNATAGGGARSILGISAEYVAASTAAEIMVWDDPNTVFVCQEDASATTTIADVGENADFVSTATSGNGVDSAVELQSSSIATTSTLQFKIQGLADQTDATAAAANAWGNHAKLLVTINTHQNRDTTGV